MSEIISLEALEQALAQLEKGIDQAGLNPADELMRDGVIQRFEYTMDICWKTIQRYLKTVAEVQDSAIRSKKDLFREAARLALIQNAEAWIGHYEARNTTSHSYNARMAQQVFDRAQLFLIDAKFLLLELHHDA